MSVTHEDVIIIGSEEFFGYEEYWWRLRLTSYEQFESKMISALDGKEQVCSDPKLCFSSQNVSERIWNYFIPNLFTLSTFY